MDGGWIERQRSMKRRQAQRRYSALLVGVAILLVSLQLFVTQAVLAHASLLTAEPAPNTQLEEPPDRITIRFTEPLEARFSEIQVLNAQGQRVDNDDSSIDKTDPTSMSVTLRPLPNGTYTVAWGTVSTVDGH
ncbi:MAG: copper resistance CopC family protein, partial [Chloroflexota bacterium]